MCLCTWAKPQVWFKVPRKSAETAKSLGVKDVINADFLGMQESYFLQLLPDETTGLWPGGYLVQLHVKFLEHSYTLLVSLDHTRLCLVESEMVWHRFPCESPQMLLMWPRTQAPYPESMQCTLLCLLQGWRMRVGLVPEVVGMQLNKCWKALVEHTEVSLWQAQYMI